MDLSCFESGAIHCEFKGYQDVNAKLSSQQDQIMQCRLLQPYTCDKVFLLSLRQLMVSITFKQDRGTRSSYQHFAVYKVKASIKYCAYRLWQQQTLMMIVMMTMMTQRDITIPKLFSLETLCICLHFKKYLPFETCCWI